MAPKGYQVLRLAQACPIVLPLTIAHQCGQAFRWRKVLLPATEYEPQRLEWSLCLRDRVVFLQHDRTSNCLYYRSVFPEGYSPREPTASWLQDYLSLEAPTNEWYAEWCEKDPIFAKHAKRFAGANILRQDPWECMCAYVARLTQFYLQLE